MDGISFEIPKPLNLFSLLIEETKVVLSSFSSFLSLYLCKLSPLATREGKVRGFPKSS
jgi:hypothetical protein